MSSVNKGHLSTMVGNLHKAKLLIGDTEETETGNFDSSKLL